MATSAVQVLNHCFENSFVFPFVCACFLAKLACCAEHTGIGLEAKALIWHLFSLCCPDAIVEFILFRDSLYPTVQYDGGAFPISYSHSPANTQTQCFV